jgi:hypothetical protein
MEACVEEFDVSILAASSILTPGEAEGRFRREPRRWICDQVDTQLFSVYDARRGFPRTPARAHEPSAPC